MDGEYKLKLDISVPGSDAKETSYVTIIADGNQRGPNVEIDAGKDQFAAINSDVKIDQSNNTIIQGDVYYLWRVVNTPDQALKQQIEQTQPTRGTFQGLNFQPSVQGDYR